MQESSSAAVLLSFHTEYPKYTSSPPTLLVYSVLPNALVTEIIRRPIFPPNSRNSMFREYFYFWSRLRTPLLFKYIFYDAFNVVLAPLTRTGFLNPPF